VRRRVDPSLILDTGATYTALPRGVADALGIESVGIRRIKLASGHEEGWPVGVILLELEDQRLPTICRLSPSDSPALLGAVTLEEFALGVDPTARRLVPVTGYLMAMAR
jgi:predicted aspartyl protease